MFLKLPSRNALVLALILAGAHTASHAVDSVALELADGNKVNAARISLQWDWQQKWWQSNGSHIGAYWDAGLAQWRGTRYQDVSGARQHLLDLNLTPVFRFQRDDRKGAYAEGGIGLHYLSKLYDNNGHQLSTRLEFGSHIGAGYVFANNLDLGIKLQHFSNGGVKKPNDGVNFIGVRAAYRF